MSSTVTASARLLASASTEYFSSADSAWNSPTGSWYYASWVYLTATGTTMLVGPGKWNNATNRSFQLYWNNGTSKFGMNQSHDGTTITSVEFGSTSTSGTWYFVEWWHDATADQIGVCVNRGTDATTAQSGGQFDSSLEFRLGARDEAGLTMNGRFQSAAWYSYMPDATFRDSLYNSGNGLLYKDTTSTQKTNLTAWWDGAETSGVLYDAHTGAHHLTDNNTVTSAVGKVTYTAEDASQFTAANSEYLSHASNSDFNTGDIDFSFAGWAYLDSLATYRILFPSKWGPSAGSWEYILEFDTPNTFGWYVTSNGSTLAGVTSTLPAVAISNWYFVVCWHDSVNNVIRISVNDGTVYSTAHTTGVYAASGQEFSPGKTSSLYMSGRMANWGYWKKVLTAAEITQLYARGFGLDYTDFDAGLLTSLVGFWPLTEASGTRVDVHGSNDLTDNNTVTGAAGVVYDAPAVITFKPSMLLLGVG